MHGERKQAERHCLKTDSTPVFDMDTRSDGSVGTEVDALTTPQLLCSGNRKYILGEIIAEGGMGTVYAANDLNCQRVVAMKVLNLGEQVSGQDLLRFVEEARITAQLEHPNIVPVYEAGLDDRNRAYYTMKYVKGITLSAILSGLRKKDQDTIRDYPLNRLLNIFQKVCDAVAFAHSRGMIHRDLKPDNIMVADYGEVLVMDWGLARLAIEDDNAPRGGALSPGAPHQPDIKTLRASADETSIKTQSGRVMGTPGYLAPEQAYLIDAPIGYAADIYALGAILYALLTLRPPLVIDHPDDVLSFIIALKANTITPPISYNDNLRSSHPDSQPAEIAFPHCPGGHIPSFLSEVCMKCLATQPKDRYASVTDVQQTIEEFQQGLTWNLLINSQFTEERELARWQVMGCDYTLDEDGLHLHPAMPQLLLYKGDLGGDIRMDFECRLTSIYLNHIGCFFSAVAGDNYKDIAPSGYEFVYGGYDNSMNVLTRSHQQVWKQVQSPLKRNTTYRVCVKRTGATISMHINDREICAYVDMDPLIGGDRTALGLSCWGSEFCIRNIQIYTRGSPGKVDLLDFAERQLHAGKYTFAKEIFMEVMDLFPAPERANRARKGHDKACARLEIMATLPIWKQRLDALWPDKAYKIRVDQNGVVLDICHLGIDDLSPLRDMPVTGLYCAHNPITSLEPLRGMPIEALNCADTWVTDLSPLTGAPLTLLDTELCGINSLAPLRGAPLNMLNCGGCGAITDLSPLRDMPLTFLSCWGNSIASLEPLRGLLLTGLYCGSNAIEDISPLQGMPLTMLHCSGNRITSLAALSDVNLSCLNCSSNQITSLAPLQHLRLNILSCQTNRITSLLPLKHMALGSLQCGNNPLTSLHPFHSNTPIEFLFDADSIPTTELEWVRAKWALDFRYRVHERNVRVLLALRKMDIPALKKLATPFRDNLYLFIPRFLAWEQACELCRELGGHLLSITHEEENSFVQSLMTRDSWFWLGLYVTDRQPHWATGETFLFDNFVDERQRRKDGPKIYNGVWTSEDVPGAQNCFMIKWSA
ncbi:MAG: hypothetical protein EOM20_07985 [Spartobacteria bacterium]|nr:hypothetical protein [Spartobacteria bacterium]